MMMFTRNDNQGTARDRWLLAAASALIVGIASFGFVGGTGLAGEGTGSGSDSSDDDDTGPGFTGFQTDEEYVGTLPTHGGDEESSSPGFFLQGPRSTILNSFVSMVGSGHFTIEVLDGPFQLGAEPTIRVSFEGDLVVTLDKCILDNSDTKFGLFTSSGIGDSIASAMTDATLLLVEAVPENTDLEIPFGAYEDSGFLENGVHVVTFNRSRGRDYLSCTTAGGLVEITQGNRL